MYFFWLSPYFFCFEPLKYFQRCAGAQPNQAKRDSIDPSGEQDQVCCLLYSFLSTVRQPLSVIGPEVLKHNPRTHTHTKRKVVGLLLYYCLSEKLDRRRVSFFFLDVKGTMILLLQHYYFTACCCPLLFVVSLSAFVDVHARQTRYFDRHPIASSVKVPLFYVHRGARFVFRPRIPLSRMLYPQSVS